MDLSVQLKWGMTMKLSIDFVLEEEFSGTEHRGNAAGDGKAIQSHDNKVHQFD